MDIKQSSLVVGSYIITPKIYKDNRGFVKELFKDCKQINHSFSNKNVLRGIHVATYAKLVTCIKGKILDVVVDLRENSPTYLKWEAVILSKKNSKQLFIPANCGHAFLSLGKSDVIYGFDSYYQNTELTIRFDDPTLAINWPGKNFILSEKDEKAMTYQEIIAKF